MTGIEYELLKKFLKMKPLTFQYIESEDDFRFIIECYEKIHKIGIVKKNKVEFVTFLLEKNAKKWWRAYVECLS